MMRNSLTVESSKARLVVDGVRNLQMISSYAFAPYRAAQGSGPWWHRTMLLSPEDRVQLSGREGTNPPEALWAILAHANRSYIPLHALVVAFFLAYSDSPDSVDHRYLLQFVTSGIEDLLVLCRRNCPIPGRADLSPTQLERQASTVIDAIIQQAGTITWPKTDGAGLQVLLYLAEYLWTFPPDLVRRLVPMTLDFYESLQQANELEDEDEEEPETDEPLTSLTPTALLRNLAALHCIQTTRIRVRGLPIQVRGPNLPLAWNQALVLMHPDSPEISGTALAWLSDGMLGDQHDIPFIQFADVDHSVANLGVSQTACIARIAQLSQEASTGTHTPSVQWEFLVSEHLPVLTAMYIPKIRVVATPTGCWVRLMPSPEVWGRVLWWNPQIEPPDCLALALNKLGTSLTIVGLHEMLWAIWRDLRVTGQPQPPFSPT